MKHIEGHRIGLLSHWDLDGAGCRILLDKLFNFDIIYSAGYNKVEQWIEDGKYYNLDKLIVADIGLTEKYFDALDSYFGKKLLVIDHHPETSLLVPKNGSTIVYDEDKSGTMLCYERFYTKYAPFGIRNLAMICDSYDLFKVEVPYWNTCDSMNTLFWHYGLFDFCRIFSDGYFKFAPDQLSILKKKMEEIRKGLAEAERNKFEEGNVLVFFPLDQDLVNRMQFAYPDHTVFICVTTWEDHFGISIRSQTHDAGQILGDLADSGKFDFVANGGGHPAAAGMGFHDGTTADQVLEVIEYLAKKFQD